MIRFLASIIIGAIVTFALYVIMSELIGSGAGSNQEKKESIVIELNQTPPESKAQQRTRVPPPPPPPPPEPPKVQPQVEQANTDASIGFNAPTIDVGGASSGLGDPSGALMRDGDATPIVRIEPKYPIQAQRDGINGWVRLRFTIMEDGSVDEVEVIDAQPKRVFDREAIRALKRWKYSPKVENGKAMRQPGQQVQLDFNLDQAGG